MSDPVDLLAAVEDLDQAGTAGGTASYRQAGAYCAGERELPFRIYAGATVAVGDQVRLGAADPPSVIVGSEVVGEVTEPHARAMKGCRELGYLMRGVVISIDDDGEKGLLSVAGEREQAA